MSSKLFGVLIVGLTLLTAGCREEVSSEGEAVVCTTEYVPAISVRVFDKETGAAIACGVTVLLVDGNFSEELIIDDNQCDDYFTFTGAGERSGNYDVSVTKEGYTEWMQYDVEVSSNLCHVNTKSLQAYLEK